MLNLEKSIYFDESLDHYEIGSGNSLYTRIVSVDKKGKTAIYIHGGGSGGNHTLLLRPTKWMIEHELFSKVILPDRRGEGLSSPLKEKLTIKDHAKDMKALLDKLEVNGPITAIGLSYGGPIAIELAAMDSRIDEVILMASSLGLRDVDGFRGFLYKHDLLTPIVKRYYRRNLGKYDWKYSEFENVYDLKTEKELMKFFTEEIKHTDKKMLESLLLQNASTLDKNNNGVSSEIELNIPICQVIGGNDEIWETNLESYKDRFPNIKSTIIENERHKGAILNAHKFYEGLLSML
ncbi:alpha/beta hydrolase [Gudongella sp. DL1XJH-153]|uniref:alpha/beta hydrolase n=1 Tax=Gudongella sp. DL1XJH-153 TaxID=3409804 RepID=UPI003BB5410D